MEDDSLGDPALDLLPIFSYPARFTDVIDGLVSVNYLKELYENSGVSVQELSNVV